MYGAPMSSNGRVVPRPSERLVASNRHGARVQQRGVGRGHVGARHDPGQPGAGERLLAAPPGDRDDGELVQPTPCVGRQELGVEEPGQLADGQAVLLDDLELPHAGGEAGSQHRSAGGAADRVGPVQHDEPRARRDSRPHRGVHRPDVGVEPRPHVLDVEDDGLDPRLPVEAGELLGRGAVGVVDHDPGARVLVVALGVPRLRRAAEAVLGPEDRHDVDPAGVDHRVHHVAEVLQDPGRVGDDTDPLARAGRPSRCGRGGPRRG